MHHVLEPATVDVLEPAMRTYVLDTSVLLSDPRAILRFKEHEVVLPIVVITELEGKRHHPELGFFARTALRLLDDLRIKAGRLDAPVPIGDEGGMLRVELNHTDSSSLLPGFRLGDNDTRILVGRQEPLQRGTPRHHREQGPADAGQGLGLRHGGAGVPRRARGRLGLDRAWPRST